MPNSYFIIMIIKRNSIVLKTKNNKHVISDKAILKEELLNKIKIFITNAKVKNNGKQYEWRYLGVVKYEESFKAYGCTISLKKCICENKEIGINFENEYNIKKAIKYRFNNDSICHRVLGKQIADNKYVVFIKEEKYNE